MSAVRKFVICCHGRTGSWALNSALSRIPELRVLGEAFHTHAQVAFGRLFETEQDIAEHAKHVSKVCDGFTLHHNQPGHKYVFADRPLVIWLTRENEADRILSWLVASVTNRWQVTDSTPEPKPITKRFTIPSVAVVSLVRQQRLEEKTIREQIENLGLTVCGAKYETMQSDWCKVLTAIGVHYTVPFTPRVARSQFRYEDVLENCDQIRRVINELSN